MARIRSTGTKPELRLRRRLWKEGFRYRLGLKVEGIRPDIVFPGRKLAIFIDGCQWHGCPEHYVAPKTRVEFWRHKLLVNIQRDERQTLALQQAGWTVCRLWEHEIWEDPDAVVALVRRIYNGDGSALREDWRVIAVELATPEQALERHHLRILGRPDSETVIEKKRTTHKWSRKVEASKQQL